MPINERPGGFIARKVELEVKRRPGELFLSVIVHEKVHRVFQTTTKTTVKIPLKEEPDGNLQSKATNNTTSKLPIKMIENKPLI